MSSGTQNTLILVSILIGLFFLTRYMSFRSLARRPALILLVSLAAGVMYRHFGLPVSEESFVSDAASIGLAGLAFAAALQFRISSLLKKSPTAFRLALIGGPVCLIATSLSAFVLLPSMTIWSAILVGAVLMINGSAFDRKAIIRSPAPGYIKASIQVESTVALALGLPIAVLIENAVTTPFVSTTSYFESSAFQTAAGFAIGGALGLLAGRFGQYRIDRGAHSTYGQQAALIYAAMAALFAFIGAPMVGADGMIAAGAVGLFWSEESKSDIKSRRAFHRMIEHTIVPIGYALFGFILGPVVLQSDMLIVFFAISAVTLLRVVPRLMSLKAIDLPDEQRVFLAWFGGAPGIASALFLLYLLDSAAVFDQTSIVEVAATCIFIGVIGTRLSSKPLASYFIKQSALARKRRFLSS